MDMVNDGKDIRLDTPQAVKEGRLGHRDPREREKGRAIAHD